MYKSVKETWVIISLICSWI